MLTLQKYMHQFVRKEFTVELRRLIHEVGLTRERIYAIAGGSSASIDKALAIYQATGGRVDPRTMATKFDWKAMDAYYAAEHALSTSKVAVGAARRADRKAAAKKVAKKTAAKTAARVARPKSGKQ